MLDSFHDSRGSGARLAAIWLAVVASACGSSKSSGFVEPHGGTELRGASQEYDWTGYSLAAGGDMNGDGHRDLLVSALSAQQGGRVSVFLGPITASEGIGEADATIVGEYGFANLGESMTRAGGCNVDGDDFDDIVLGAAFADVAQVAPNPATSGDNRGKAYLFLGRADLAGTIDARDASVQFLGESDYDAAGSTTACLGDLDGDGFDDIAVAARRNSRGSTRAGSVYLIYGRADLPVTFELASADAIFVGEAAYDGAGIAVSPAGDVNDDGLADILIGAPLSDAGGAESGVVYLVPGNAGRFRGEIELAAAVRVKADEPGLRLGWSLDRAGDVDGDGIDDVILGSQTLPGPGDAGGAAWLLRGGADLTGEVDLARRGTRLSGEQAGDGAGMGVAGVGDISGDGLSDIVVGAGLAQGDGTGGGRAYLVLGRKELPATLDLASADWIGNGPTQDAYYGENVVGLGDIDGDDLPDFAISARGTQVEAAHAGVVHIYRGQE